MRYSPAAQIKAYRNPDFAFDPHTSPRIDAVAQVLGMPAATTLLQAQLLNYATLNNVKPPEGPGILQQISDFLYEQVKFWNTGELLYFFFMLNNGDFGNTHFLSPATLREATSRFEKLRQQKRTDILERQHHIAYQQRVKTATLQASSTTEP